MVDFGNITNKVSNIGTVIRHALTIIGGALMGFGVATQIQVDQLAGAWDNVVAAVTGIVTSAGGLVGAATAIIGLIASFKGNIKSAAGK